MSSWVEEWTNSLEMNVSKSHCGAQGTIRCFFHIRIPQGCDFSGVVPPDKVTGWKIPEICECRMDRGDGISGAGQVQACAMRKLPARRLIRRQCRNALSWLWPWRQHTQRLPYAIAHGSSNASRTKKEKPLSSGGNALYSTQSQRLPATVAHVSCIRCIRGKDMEAMLVIGGHTLFSSCSQHLSKLMYVRVHSSNRLSQFQKEMEWGHSRTALNPFMIASFAVGVKCGCERVAR